MIRRSIDFSPEARADLIDLYDWVANAASPDTAMAYIERIEQFISGLELGPERGTRRDDIRPGLRTVGFERRLTVAFVVREQVTVLRIFYGGRDWEDALAPH